MPRSAICNQCLGTIWTEDMFDPVFCSTECEIYVDEVYVINDPETLRIIHSFEEGDEANPEVR